MADRDRGKPAKVISVTRLPDIVVASMLVIFGIAIIVWPEMLSLQLERTYPGSGRIPVLRPIARLVGTVAIGISIAIWISVLRSLL